jgi:branched-chain amino acid transport system ATP-binding protein
MSEALFVCDDVAIRRGRREVLSGISLEVWPGRVTVLLGPNGSGKTTLMRALSGAIPVASGSVSLGGLDITHARPLKRARLGLACVEQGRTIFAGMNAEDNLRIVNDSDEALEAVLERLPELRPKLRLRAGLLSGGEQQMLMLGRALIARPRVLLVDEMSLGLAPVIVSRMLTLLSRLAAEEGLSVLIVEQFARLALTVAETAYVLRRGQLTFSGPASELRDEPERLDQAYFGSSLLHQGADPGR